MNQVDDEGNAVVFSVKFLSLNRQKGKGGKWIELQQACLSRQRQPNSSAKSSGSGKVHEQLKAPRHEANGTVNFLNVANGSLVKAHWKLITRFNGERVL
jgi:hypothetical protein